MPETQTDPDHTHREDSTDGSAPAGEGDKKLVDASPSAPSPPSPPRVARPRTRSSTCCRPREFFLAAKAVIDVPPATGSRATSRTRTAPATSRRSRSRDPALRPVVEGGGEAIGLDIGGTKINAFRVARDGSILARSNAPPLPRTRRRRSR